MGTSVAFGHRSNHTRDAGKKNVTLASFDLSHYAAVLVMCSQQVQCTDSALVEIN